MSSPAATAAKPAPTLRRALGLWLLTFYGLGTIIGAGIYVLIGEVADAAGMTAPLAFLAAGLLAVLTGLCYAELAGRFPEASGSASHRWLSLIALIAILSGILIQVVMAARLLYGMARHGLLPAWLGQVSRYTRAPVRATLTVGAVSFVAAVAFPFGGLVAATSGLTLIIFFFVSLALWRLHRTRPPVESGFRAPRWAPPVAALLCLGLLTIQMFGWLFG